MRFQQTCGPVMAKAVEDTAFYRWTHLIGLNEVGGAPERFAISPMELHAFAARAVDHAPLAMTGLSTHDTKRSEDVRMRLNVLSECAPEWAAHVERVREATVELRSPLVDGRMENFVWQTLVGTWSEAGPIAAERLEGYLVKAMREAKTHTTWTEQHADYEQAVIAFATGALTHPEVAEAHADWLALTGEAVRAATLGVKLVQLTLPGRPRRLPGHRGDGDRAGRPGQPPGRSTSDISMDVSARWTAVRLPAISTTRSCSSPRGRCARDAITRTPSPASRPVTVRCPAPAATRCPTRARRVRRREWVVVATRLPVSLERYGGWQEHSVALPALADGRRRWRCALSGRTFESGETSLATLLDDLPVALLTGVAGASDEGSRDDAGASATTS